MSKDSSSSILLLAVYHKGGGISADNVKREVFSFRYDRFPSFIIVNWTRARNLTVLVGDDVPLFELVLNGLPNKSEGSWGIGRTPGRVKVGTKLVEGAKGGDRVRARGWHSLACRLIIRSSPTISPPSGKLHKTNFEKSPHLNTIEWDQCALLYSLLCST